MRRWELWSKGGDQVFFTEDNAQARRMAEEEGMTFECEVMCGYGSRARRSYSAQLCPMSRQKLRIAML